MEPWEIRSQQPLKRVSEFVQKTSSQGGGNNQQPSPYLQHAQPQVQQFAPVQPFGGHAITQEQIKQTQVQQQSNDAFEIPVVGTVALLWRDNIVDPNQIPKEDGFPTFSNIYMCDYRDYSTEEEKIAAVEYFTNLISQYNAKTTPIKGSYTIMTGALVDKIVTKKVILY